MRQIKGMEIHPDGSWTCLTVDGELHEFGNKPLPSYRADCITDVPMLDVDNNCVCFGTSAASYMLKKMIKGANEKDEEAPMTIRKVKVTETRPIKGMDVKIHVANREGKHTEM